MYEPVAKALDKPIVKVIPATKTAEDEAFVTKKLRVCAYGRVSTDSDEQQTSFEAQKSYYTNKIAQNYEWDFVGFYSDEGITGTSTKRRTGFKTMIEDCQAGKIDLVLTKSISRFSRNTLDSIAYVRMLRALGIGIIFEKENIHTLESTSELLFTVLSALAQEEITSMSKNIAFGHRERARQGKVTYHYGKWYAYKKGIDGKPEIIPEEARVVERIFVMYLSGDSLKGIAKVLNDESIPLMDGKKWSPGIIRRILQNEKYCGNALSQKTITIDPISGVRVKNTGQLPQYLVKQAHDAIITEQTYNLAQLELAKRHDIKRKLLDNNKQSKYSALYALTERLCCGNCKMAYKRKVWKNRDGSNRYVWVCVGRTNKKGHKKCQSPTIDEYRIHRAILDVFNQFLQNDAGITNLITDSIKSALNEDESTLKAEALSSQINKLQVAFSELIALSVETQNPNIFENRFKLLSDEIVKKQAELKAHEKHCVDQNEIEDKMNHINALLDKMPRKLTEYEDKLVRQTIEQIVVIDVDHLKIKFVGGREVEVEIPPREK